MPYATWQPLLAPPWFQGPFGAALLRQFGAAKDDLRDRTTQAVRARFPTLAPSDAQDLIGRERQIARGPGESNALYGERLRHAWEAWGLAGSWLGLLRILRASGYDNIVGVQWNGRYAQLDGSDNLVLGDLGVCQTRDPPHPGWVFDVAETFWSRFMLVVPTSTPIFTTPSGQATLNQIVRLWKPAVATFMGTVIINSGRIWGWPVQTWGDLTTWGPDMETFIAP